MAPVRVAPARGDSLLSQWLRRVVPNHDSAGHVPTTHSGLMLDRWVRVELSASHVLTKFLRTLSDAEALGHL